MNKTDARQLNWKTLTLKITEKPGNDCNALATYTATSYLQILLRTKLESET